MTEPVWIDERETLAIHDLLLARHGGATGLRDEGLLKSALARPLQHFAYGQDVDWQAYPEARAARLVELATVYTAGILRNHPFVDGNKRTGFVVGILFLELNGFRFTASEESATQAVIQLAAGELSEDGYTAFLRANVAPAATH